MNDKQKQIEEMAKRIHIATDLYYIECIKIATYLFEKDNCRIVDKDSIVVKKSILKEELRSLEIQARKETAKELLTAQLKECIEAEKRVLKIRKSKDDLYYNGFSLAITNLKMYIKELAREYGVELL